MIQVGIVGLGSEWESFAPVFQRMRHPVEVVAVFDPVFAKAERIACNLSADVVTGLQALADHTCVEAVLLFDAGPGGFTALELLLRGGKPVFVAPSLAADAGRIEALFETSSHSGVSVMPAMWRRYAPSVIRLQELMATELGPIRNISIEIPLKESRSPGELSESLVGWLDLCRSLFRVFPVDMRMESNADDLARRVLDLRVSYEKKSTATSESTEQPVDESGCAVLRLVPDSPGVDPLTELRSELADFENARSIKSRPRNLQLPNVQLLCDRGTAQLRSRTEIEWQSTGAEPVSEKLNSDRSENEILLDVFCRRVVGGLIPVPDYNDVCRALSLLHATMES